MKIEYAHCGCIHILQDDTWILQEGCCNCGGVPTHCEIEHIEEEEE